MRIETNGHIDKINNDKITNGKDVTILPVVFPEQTMSESEKIMGIAMHFGEIMKILGLSLLDEGLINTPERVARMYVTETYSGLLPENKPSVTLFENPYHYDQMLIEKNITVYSTCEHHFVPIIGRAHVAYISTGKVIGLSKINRLVNYFSSRPQVQERLTIEIAHELKEVLSTQDVAVIIDAIHHCVSSRGIKDTASSTITSYYSGRFRNEDFKKEFLMHVG